MIKMGTTTVKPAGASKVYVGEELVYLRKTVGPSTIVSVDDAAPLDAEGLVAQIEPVQAGSGDPSPDNVRPISGWTRLEVKHSGADTSDLTILPITFPASAGTVYGGYVDLVKGKLVQTYAAQDLASRNWVYSAGVFGSDQKSDQATNGKLICSGYKWNSTSNILPARLADCEISASPYFNRNTVMVKDGRFTTAADFKAAVSGVQLVYELATPITYDIDPVTLTLLRGDNNVWADTGDTTLTYQVDIPLYKQHQANS